jgi:CDP-diacylglycerol--glycerol-3-phosphate 3-phosphatidyltransferase
VIGLLAAGAGPAFALPAGLILFREFAVSALREVGAARGLKLPVTGLAKWKTAVQLVALATMLGTALLPFLPPFLPLGLVWVAALLTVWTGIEYLVQTRRGLASLT